MHLGTTENKAEHKMKQTLTIHFAEPRKSSSSCAGLKRRHTASLVFFNSLNAELNPIYDLIILLGDLTFMGTCIVSLSNKMQLYTVYLYLQTAVHVEQFPDINKLCNVATCWIYIGILLGAHPVLHISRIKVNDAL
jgi:hypothetical protein